MGQLQHMLKHMELLTIQTQGEGQLASMQTQERQATCTEEGPSDLTDPSPAGPPLPSQLLAKHGTRPWPTAGQG